MMQTVSFPNNAKSSASYIPYLKQLRAWLEQKQKELDKDLALLGFSRKAVIINGPISAKSAGNGRFTFFKHKSDKTAPAMDADTGQQNASQGSSTTLGLNTTTGGHGNGIVQASNGHGITSASGSGGNDDNDMDLGDVAAAFEQSPGLIATAWWDGEDFHFKLSSGQRLWKQVSLVGVETYLETAYKGSFVPLNINAIPLRDHGLLHGHLVRAGTSQHWLFAPNTPQLNIIAETTCAQRG